jgi:hypothetical protein
MANKLRRDQYDELDRALNEVEHDNLSLVL